MTDQKGGTAPRLKESRMTIAEARRTIHFVTPEAGTEPDALLDGAYWTHVANKLRPTDRIEAVCEDGSWFQELFVVYAGGIEAKMARLNLTMLEQVEPDAMSNDLGYVKWSGPVDRWRVIRQDGHILAKGFASKGDAVAHLQMLRPKAA